MIIEPLDIYMYGPNAGSMEIAVSDTGTDDELTALIDRVADVRGTKVEDLPPIHDTMDGDVVGYLLASDFPGKCTFRYAGCEIVITADSVDVLNLSADHRLDEATLR